MTNEQRQAWQRFYSAALTGLMSQLGNGLTPESRHRAAVIAADLGIAHYAALIPPKKGPHDPA